PENAEPPRTTNTSRPQTPQCELCPYRGNAEVRFSNKSCDQIVDPQHGAPIVGDADCLKVVHADQFRIPFAPFRSQLCDCDRRYEFAMVVEILPNYAKLIESCRPLLTSRFAKNEMILVINGYRAAFFRLVAARLKNPRVDH